MARSDEELAAHVVEWEDRPEHVRVHNVPFVSDEGHGVDTHVVYHPGYIAALRRCADRLLA